MYNRVNLHRELVAYINSGCLTRSDKIMSFFFGKMLFYKNAKKIFTRIKSTIDSNKNSNSGSRSHHILVEPMKVEVKYIMKLNNYLNKELKDDLYGAYFHGSIGVDEKINYSDVDALIIIEDEVFRNPKRLAGTSYRLNRALKYFYEIDPLQHHGWFVLTESDLRDYPQTYFPWELFKYSKSLFPDKGLHLNLNINNDKQDFSGSFLNLAHSIIEKIETGTIPSNIYQLKSFLSEFMLLPTLYLQAKEKKGIYKKNSFKLARGDFNRNQWRIMEEVSEIRLNWNYSLSALQSKMLKLNHPALRKLVVNHFSPSIPMEIKNKLSHDFYQRVKDLCLQMIDNHEAFNLC